MHNRLWICDVNGVLVDSTSLICAAFAATAEHFDFAWTERELAQVKGLWLLEAYRVLDSERDPFLLREFHLKYCRTRIEEVRAFAGVADVLAHARASGVRVAAATSHGELAEATLVATGLYPLIDCLLTQEEVRRPKPHPEILLRILTV
jgi:beta-phosphoglucomutase-like phosphatase (HAD superfamily)